MGGHPEEGTFHSLNITLSGNITNQQNNTIRSILLRDKLRNPDLVYTGFLSIATRQLNIKGTRTICNIEPLADLFAEIDSRAEFTDRFTMHLIQR